MTHKPILDRYSLADQVKSLVRVFSFDPWTGRVHCFSQGRNLVVYSGADILAKLLSGASGYAIAGMYLEFKNLGVPGTPITPPTFDRSGGIGYYNGLSSSADVDFLRVPLTVPGDIQSTGAEYNGNQLTFFAQSEGSTGFHGKPFGSSSNSEVYGAGLIAMPDESDQAQDVVYARTYDFTQVPKEDGFEIGITWVTRFS